jgi:hypothetical protein
MNIMRLKIATYVAGSVVLSMALAGARSLADSVTNNGQTMTNDARTLNGKVYVPLADVARSLNETVVRGSNGYALIPAGGANQMANRFVGKVGEVVFTGQFRFTVISFETATSYSERYLPIGGTITADQGQEFVIVRCRIKNATPSRQEIALDLSPYSGNDDTTLTDDHEQTYQPINYHGGQFVGYDVHPGDSAPTGVWMLPGAAADFNVVFGVPTGANPKDFIFGIQKYNRTTKGKQTDIRISLH